MDMLFIDSGGFLNNLRMTRNPVFAYFWVSGTFQRLNEPNFFATSFFQEIEDREKKRSMRRSTRQERGGTTQAPPLAMWWAPTSPSWTLLQLCSPLRNHLDLKPTIYMTPPRLFHDGAAKQRIHNTNMKTARIWGKTLPSYSQLSLRLQWHHHLHHHDKKASSSSLDYEIVEVTCINLFITIGVIQLWSQSW
jgi:hypothetical protein